MPLNMEVHFKLSKSKSTMSSASLYIPLLLRMIASGRHHNKTADYLVSFIKAIGGGVQGQKSMLILNETTFRYASNAANRVAK